MEERRQRRHTEFLAGPVAPDTLQAVGLMSLDIHTRDIQRWPCPARISKM